MIPVPVMEPTLPPADQSLPDSDQENIPPRMVTPPPLNVLVPVEGEIQVKECCQRTLAVCNQRAVRGRGATTKPFRPTGQKQLASVSKIIAMLQDSVTNWHFSRLSMLSTPFTLLSLHFTLQEKTIRVLLNP